MTKITAKAIAERTSGAYSFDRYRNWDSVAAALIGAGFTAAETEAIMLSKWARWAADSYDRYENIPAKALVNFAKAQTRNELNSLVAETFAIITESN